jgi:ferrochelatase
MTKPAQHPAVKHGRLGVLLVNLGTPDAPDTASVRRYLREFLMDRRVIEVSPLIWWPILFGPLLTFRPKKSAAAYQKIWLDNPSESPLRRYTREQAERLQQQRPEWVIDWAMRYGNPSVSSRIHALMAEGCDRLLVLPLYPQYSATTSASVTDAVFATLKKMRWQPTLRVAHPWHDHPAHIDALVAQTRDQLALLEQEPEVLVFSFHGLPQAYFDKGDPYYCHCQKTARLLREGLGWPAERVRVTFQSRLGPTKWLQPYTAEVMKKLPAEGIKRIAVATPGFVSDCVETLEEIAIEAKADFIEAGGEVCDVIPCLNANDYSIEMLNKIVTQEMQGWC